MILVLVEVVRNISIAMENRNCEGFCEGVSGRFGEGALGSAK